MTPIYPPLMTKPEIGLLVESVGLVAPSMRHHRWVEFGAAVGGSAVVVMDEMARLGIISQFDSVDLFTRARPAVAEWTNGADSDQRRALATNVAAFDWHNTYDGSTADYMRDHERVPLAWLLVDADHSYASAFHDILFADNIIAGGVLLIHDIGHTYTENNGPSRALRAWWKNRTGWNWYDQRDSLIVIQRAE